MPLSRVEEWRWFSGEWLTRLSHISFYPHSVHVHPSTPRVSAQLIPPSSSHPLPILSHQLSPSQFSSSVRSLLASAPLPCWSPPLYHLSSCLLVPPPIFSQRLLDHVHIYHLPIPLALSLCSLYLNLSPVHFLDFLASFYCITLSVPHIKKKPLAPF